MLSNSTAIVFFRSDAQDNHILNLITPLNLLSVCLPLYLPPYLPVCLSLLPSKSLHLNFNIVHFVQSSELSSYVNLMNPSNVLTFPTQLNSLNLAKIQSFQAHFSLFQYIQTTDFQAHPGPLYPSKITTFQTHFSALAHYQILTFLAHLNPKTLTRVRTALICGGIWYSSLRLKTPRKQELQSHQNGTELDVHKTMPAVLKMPLNCTTKQQSITNPNLKKRDNNNKNSPLLLAAFSREHDQRSTNTTMHQISWQPMLSQP